MKLKIVNLAYHREHFPIVCRWLWQYWGRKSGQSLKDVEYRTRHCLGRGKVPMTFVALLSGKPVGTFSIWTNDLKSRQDLGPWLAALYVPPKMRKRGIGTRLQKEAMKKAAALGHGKLYLITDLEGYYEKGGWSFMGMAPLQDKKVRLYERRLGQFKPI